MADTFPSKLALGKQFCNREKERELLKDNIKAKRHSVLISPRRYGKSSLAHKVVEEIKIPIASVDLFLANNDQTMAKRIIAGIAEATSQILPVSEKMLAKAQSFFQQFKITLSAKHFNIEASLQSATSDPTEQIFNALRSLDKLAKEKQKIILFFIDEFQDIAQANNSKAIQGAIRNIAQQTQHLVFIFSGSNRHLLLELFDDSSMPLYMLCDKIHLERIASKDYEKFIQKAANEKWQKTLSNETFECIMKLTERHAFYVNMICNLLWKSKTLPDIDNVYDTWNLCLENEERRLIAELEKLTKNQQEVLKNLAANPVSRPMEQSFLNTTKIAASSSRQTIASLLQKDMIYSVKQTDDMLPHIKKNQLRVLDPLLAYALRKLS